MNRGIAVGMLWMVAAGICLAQDESLLETMAPQRGTVPYGTYSIDKLENINVSSGSLGYRIPIASLPKGRGGFEFGLDLLYSSDLYDVGYASQTYESNGTTTTFNVPSLTESEWGGWSYGFAYSLNVDSALSPNGCDIGAGTQYPTVFRLSVIFPDGSHHTLRPEAAAAGTETYNGYFLTYPTGAVAANTCNTNATAPAAMTYFTSDSTYLRLSTAPGAPTSSAAPSSCQTALFNWTLNLPDGGVVYGCDYSPWRVQDANGNGYNIASSTCSITVNTCGVSSIPNSDMTVTTTLTDDVGRVITLNHLLSPTGAISDTIVWNEFNGQTDTAYVYYGTVNTSGAMEYPGELENYGYNATTGAGVNGLYVVSSIQLPVGLPYVFGYAVAGGDNLTAYGGTDPCQFLNAERNYSGGGWGELNCVQTPAGGIVSYLYQLDGGGTRQDGALTQNPVVGKSVLQSTPNSTTDTWTYSYSMWTTTDTCTHGSSCTFMKAPDQGVTEFDYFPEFQNFGGKTFLTVFPDQSKSATLWASNSLAPLGQTVDSLNAYPATTSHYVASGATASAQTITLDLNGNTTQKYEYDFLAASQLGNTYDLSGPYISSSGLLRQTTATYQVLPATASTAFQSNSNAPVRWDLVTYKTVSGASGTESPAVEFEYDNHGNPAYEWHYADSKCSGGCLSSFLSSPSSSNATTTGRGFDSNGNLTGVMDPTGHTTYYTFDTTYNLYPTQITYGNGSGHRTFVTNFDFSSGLPITITDNDNTITDTYNYDSVGRVTSDTRSAGGSNVRLTAYGYDDYARQSVMTTDAVSAGDQKLVSEGTWDQLDRPYLTRQNECTSESATDDTAGIKSAHLYMYSGANRYELESKPYRGSSLCGGAEPADQTIGWTLTKYDNMSRPVEIDSYDGGTSATNYPSPFGSGSLTLLGTTTMSYQDNVTTTVDPAGASKTTTVDGLGRLTGVDENGPVSGGVYPSLQHTTYVYDAADDLLSVTQPGMGTPCSVLGTAVTRGFVYDSLGRLTSACNPESNTIQWTYDDSGNPLSRTQLNAGGSAVSTTNMVYGDPLGRITSKSYLNDTVTPPVTDTITAPVTYSYNFSSGGGQAPYSFGELTSISTSATSAEPAVTRSILGYDPASGKETGITQQVGSGSAYLVSHAWGPTGLLTQTTMGSSGRVVTYTYDGAGHATSVTGMLNGVQTVYAPSVEYAPHGGVESLSLHNGVTESTVYTANLETSSIAAMYTPSGGSTQTLFGVSYGYGSGTDNGNVMSQTITRSGSTWSQSFGYTEPTPKMWNRLTLASEAAVSGGTAWSQSFAYDNLGNRALTGYPGFPSSPSNEVPQALSVYGTNDQMTGGSWGYDGAGNITNFNGVRTASYDAENRIYTATQNGITQQQNVTETYAYDGEGRRVSKTGPDGTWTYLYDANGDLASEYPTPTALSLAATTYLTVDALGSTRLVTDGSANQLVCEDFLPFGEEIPSGMNGRSAACFSGADQLPEAQFTGKPRDVETGMDYFGARYMSSAQGRFTSPDPLTGTPLHIINPQRWNMYAYAVNSPLFYTDPDGRDAIAVNFSKEIPLVGHMGIISVHQDGTAEYGRFGPAGGSSPVGSGQVQTAALPNVMFGADGLPTNASYLALAQAVGKIEGENPTSVRMAYFRTSQSDTLALDAWLKAKQDASNKKSLFPYFVLGNSCADFCINGLSTAHALSSSQAANASTIPNLLFLELSKIAASVSTGETRNPKEDVTERVCYEGDDSCGGK